MTQVAQVRVKLLLHQVKQARRKNEHELNPRENRQQKGPERRGAEVSAGGGHEAGGARVLRVSPT